MKLKEINNFINETQDITHIETIELMYEIVNEYKLMEVTIDQAYLNKLNNIKKGYELRSNKNIPKLGGVKHYLNKQWLETKLERLKNWKEKYSTMNAKNKKSLLDKIRLGYAKANPNTIKNIKRGGLGLAAAGMGYATYKAFKKDKD